MIVQQPSQQETTTSIYHTMLSPSAESMRSSRALERESLLIPPSPQHVAIPQGLASPSTSLRARCQHDMASNSSMSTRPWEYEISDDGGEEGEGRQAVVSSPEQSSVGGGERRESMGLERSRRTNGVRADADTATFTRAVSPLALLRARGKARASSRESDLSERGGRITQALLGTRPAGLSDSGDPSRGKPTRSDRCSGCSPFDTFLTLLKN